MKKFEPGMWYGAVNGEYTIPFYTIYTGNPAHIWIWGKSYHVKIRQKDGVEYLIVKLHGVEYTAFANSRCEDWDGRTEEDFGLLNQLKDAGAQSNPNIGCGIHIHLGLANHTAKTLTNLARIIAAHEEQLAKAVNVDKYRLEHYCKPIELDFLQLLDEIKPKNLDEFAAVWYCGNHADDDQTHYNPSRYHAINFHSCFTHKTIEFRLFQFSDKIDCDELRAYIQLVLAINELAKNVKFASSRKPQDENDKYAFRVWLLRLGFIGDEFRTSRKILLKHLKGDCAWRHI